MNHDILKDRLRKALGDPHYLSKKTREKCRMEVEEVMQSLVPSIQEAVSAVEVYNQRPSIQTGRRRAVAQEKARQAREDVAEFLWARYDIVYNGVVSREEMEGYIKEELQKLTEECGVEVW